MGLKDIETLIGQKLATDISGVAVESFPENFSEYLDKFSHPVGVVLLAFKGATYGKDSGLGLTVQDKKLDLTATIIIRASKIEQVYPYIETLEQSLMGYKMPGCEKIYFTKSTFIGEDYGKFVYQADFSTSTKAVEAVPADTNALLKKITNVNNFGEVTEVISNNV